MNDYELDILANKVANKVIEKIGRTQSLPMYDRLLTREEVAEHLQVSTKKVRRLEQEGMLPRIDLGRTAIRYRPDAVKELLEKLTRKQAKYRLY